jgi:hypothetical protein
MTFAKYSEFRKVGVKWFMELPSHWAYGRLQTVAGVIDPQPDHRAPAEICVRISPRNASVS